MPPRFVSVAILIFWATAAWRLVDRDLIPELTVTQPPDLRTITRAEADSVPARWAVQVLDTPGETRRTVGEAVTQAVRQGNGSIVLESHLWFDSGSVLQGTGLASVTDVRLDVNSTYHIDPSGNLQSFQLNVVAPLEPGELLKGELLKVDGRLRKHELEITMKGPIPILNRSLSVPYEARGVVQNTFGPVDRLPGLRVGLKWNVRVVDPFKGDAVVVRVEVPRTVHIQWNGTEVEAYEVIQHMAPISARTWVHPDGTVLRQEIPFPIVKLFLERLPELDSESARGSTP
jgi:hypothetical protein